MRLVEGAHMNSELEQMLFENYPLLFRGRSLPPDQSSMHWGIQADDGWFSLIDRLSCKVECEIRRMRDIGIPEDELPVAVQVKEKFGSLRFHLRQTTDTICELCEAARGASTLLCEICGRDLDVPAQSQVNAARCEECRMRTEA